MAPSLDYAPRQSNQYLAAVVAPEETAERRSQPAIASFSLLLMTLIGSAVRHAIALEPVEATRALRQFKALLPRDLASLD